MFKKRSSHAKIQFLFPGASEQHDLISVTKVSNRLYVFASCGSIVTNALSRFFYHLQSGFVQKLFFHRRSKWRKWHLYRLSILFGSKRFIQFYYLWFYLKYTNNNYSAAFISKEIRHLLSLKALFESFSIYRNFSFQARSGWGLFSLLSLYKSLFVLSFFV